MGYKYYFQYTLNPYGPEIEPHLPPLEKRVALLKEITGRLGKAAVVWRYDPILLIDKIIEEDHADYFARLAGQLAGSTRRCVISFVDMYAKTRRNMKRIALRELTEESRREIAGRLAAIARSHGIELQSCSETIDLSGLGIKPGKCIDGDLIERIIGCGLLIGKDKNQRAECGCVESVDIGAYNTCRHGCVYCYANFSPKTVETNCRGHDPAGEILTGTVGADEKVTERKAKSNRDWRPRLF